MSSHNDTLIDDLHDAAVALEEALGHVEWALQGRAPTDDWGPHARAVALLLGHAYENIGRTTERRDVDIVVRSIARLLGSQSPSMTRRASPPATGSRRNERRTDETVIV